MLLLHRRYDEYERLLADTRVLDRDLEGAILDVCAVVSAMVVRLNEIGYTHLSILREADEGDCLKKGRWP